MSQLLLDRLKVKDYKRGYVKLSDDSIAILRVSIVDVKPLQTPLQFDVITVGGISVIPSEDARNEVKDKPLAEPGKLPTGGWSLLDIVEKQSAYEEVEYITDTKEKYLIMAEMEPLMASKNSNYRNQKGEPIYIINAVTKTSWKKVE